MWCNFTHSVLFLEVCVLGDGSLVLHPLSVGLVHLLGESALLLRLLLSQLPVGLSLKERGGERNEGGEGGTHREK